MSDSHSAITDAFSTDEARQLRRDNRELREALDAMRGARQAAEDTAARQATQLQRQAELITKLQDDLDALRRG